MKTRLLLLSFLIGLTAYSQGQSDQDSKVSKVLNSYLEAANAVNLDTISSITTTYKGQSPLGEITIQKTTTKGQISEKWSLAGNTLFHIVAGTDQCYQVSAGEKVMLPENMCNDFKPFLGLFLEQGLLNHAKVEVEEIQVDGEQCYSLTIPGESTTQHLMYSKETGLKIKEKQITKSGDKISESGTAYKEYKEYDSIKFPTIQTMSNFLQTGTDVELKLDAVEFNTAEMED